MERAMEIPIFDRDIDISVISVRSGDSEQLDEIKQYVMMLKQTRRQHAIPVILISKSRQHQHYIMTTENDQLLLTPNQINKTVIYHDLQEIHVVSLDYENEKLNSSDPLPYQCMINQGRQFRSLFFGSLQEMKVVMNFIMHCQNLTAERSDQYKHLCRLDLHSLVGEYSVVKHRLTQEKFICKMISKTADNWQIELIRQEIEVLRECRKQKCVAKIVDVIEDS